jgi:hypothetical protein
VREFRGRDECCLMVCRDYTRYYVRQCDRGLKQQDSGLPLIHQRHLYTRPPTLGKEGNGYELLYEIITTSQVL